MTKHSAQDLPVNTEQVKKPKLDSYTTLVWFRSDLRIHDNTALFRSSVLKNPIIALFIISPQEWKNHDYSPCKVDFILRNLSALQIKLKELGIPLLIRVELDSNKVPSTVGEIANQVNAKNVFWNIEYEVNEGKRDRLTRSILENQGREVYELHDQCIIQPGNVRTKEGKIYHVFTPFKNTWIQHIYSHPTILNLNSIEKQHQETIFKDFHSLIQQYSSIPSCKEIGFELKGLSIDINKEWPAGEEAATARLDSFLSDKVKSYDVARNFPITQGTSRLSAYLAIGILSPRHCMSEAKKRNGGKLDAGNAGLTVWISELIWREFYRNILFAYPHVCKNKAFKPDMDSIPWSYDSEKFTRWCQGKTGYPIVDAGMRQLNQTGWMHNRLRMIVSMFLTKHLLIDWYLTFFEILICILGD